MIPSFHRSFLSSALVAASLLVGSSHAESHTITFVNNCGFGTPTLIQGPNTLSTGAPFTSNGDFPSAIAYLQTGKCLFNGEDCTLLEMTLGNPNPNVPGSGSSVDISLIPPHNFSVATSFAYTNGCDGTGASCDSASCQMAFRNPNDNWAQVACQADNVGLIVTFCDGTTPVNTPVASPTKGQSSKPAAATATPTQSTKPVTCRANRAKRHRLAKRSIF